MEFRIETILTLLTGVLFEFGLSNLKLLIEFLSGEPASELTLIAEEEGRINICRQALLQQHPRLAFVPPGLEIDHSNYLDVLEMVRNELGDSLFLKPIEDMPSPPKKYLELT